MREVGVPFKGQLALANLDGRKTQTRRLVSSPKWSLLDGGPCVKKVWAGLQWDRLARCSEEDMRPGFIVPDQDGRWRHVTPRYRVGDRFWQREMHRLWCPEEECWHVRYRADETVKALQCDWDEGPQYLTPTDAGCADEPTRWRPSIHMPREASRCLLEITDVRGQRIQEISEDDAKAEGCHHIGRGSLNAHGEEILESCVEWFMRIWESINGPRGHGWGTNPPVWPFTYRRIA
uniref:Uncharacterized protein n=1 Tax=viral metagenome TaxID=1070528 RepID=A0A6H1ZE23_9ZZZZ